MEQPTCATCPYWVNMLTDDNEGECWRYAPRPVLRGQIVGDLAVVVDPIKYAFEFCGEHPRFDAWIDATRDDCAKEHQP